MCKNKLVIACSLTIWSLSLMSCNADDRSFENLLLTRHSKTSVRHVGESDGVVYGIVCEVKGSVVRRLHCTVYQKIGDKCSEVFTCSFNTADVVVAVKGDDIAFNKTGDDIVLLRMNLNYMLIKPDLALDELMKSRAKQMPSHTHKAGTDK